MAETILEEKMSEIVAAGASEKKAQDIIILDMRKVFPVTDFFIIASARSTTQSQAIADSIEEKMEEAGYKALHKEGYREARWILLDYGSVVAHVFVDEDRRFYNLEQLWADAPSRRYED